MTARFSFQSPEFRVEFKGSEEFVSEQLGRIGNRVRGILGQVSAGSSSELAPGIPTAGDPPPVDAVETRSATGLEEFYRQARTREGRGALQDSILLFACYLQEKQSKHEFSIEDLNFCFDLLNQKRPKSLANTLGILKRDRRLLHSGSRRGTYSLSEKGLEKARRLIRR